MKNIIPTTDQIKENIKKFGVSCVRVIPRDSNEKICNYNEIQVYTIGHRERGRPELFIACGPLSPIKLTHEKAVEITTVAINLIFNLVKNWNITPLIGTMRTIDSEGIVYELFLQKEKELKELMTETTRYYGNDVYQVLLLVPVDRPAL